MSRNAKFSALGSILIVLILGVVLLGRSRSVSPPVVTIPLAPTTSPIVTPSPTHTVIGLSVEGRSINAYTYGEGTTTLVFVGGMHGGYEWNSVLLAYEFMDYLDEHPQVIPVNMTIAIIPSANPDGVYKVTKKVGRFTLADVGDISKKPEGYGRFNAHDVDLNRNFDCKWQAKSTWKGHAVSAGTKAFSEPESTALRDFFLAQHPSGVIFWHSQANAVYASECKSGILPNTLLLMNTYAKAAGYSAVKSFDAYTVTGDAEGWLASVGVPAITVELKTHQSTEWDRNLLAIKALLNHYRK